MEEEKFGDFKEAEEQSTGKKGSLPLQPTHTRVRLPRGKEVIGVISQRLGGNRMEVRGTDGRIRNCRVPGRFKRSMWLRPKDIVIIQPWEGDDEKGDVIFKYQSPDIIQLKKRGLLANLTEEF